MEQLNSKIVCLALCLAAVLTGSCVKAPPVIQPHTGADEPGEKAYSKLSLRTAGSSTASLAAWIRTPFESFFGYSASGEVEIICPADYQADFFIAINIPGCSLGINPEDLQADISQVTLPNLPAVGTICGYMLQRGPQTVQIQAYRPLAKITVGTVENRLEEPPYAGESIILDSLFVINGKGRFKVFDYDDLSGIENWFMPSGARGSGLGQMPLPPLAGTTLGGSSLAYGSSTALDKTLYTGPNHCIGEAYSREAGPGWTPRKTRVILACRIGGLRCYFPVTIDDISENTFYHIKKLTIKRFGVTAPDLPFSFDEESLSFELVEWEEVQIGEII